MIAPAYDPGGCIVEVGWSSRGQWDGLLECMTEEVDSPVEHHVRAKTYDRGA